VHLYSDGGIDVSHDGRYLLTCARVHVPPFYHEWQVGNSAKHVPHHSTSPNSHPARVVADERESFRLKSILRNPLPVEGYGRAHPVAAPQPLPPPPPLFSPQNRRKDTAVISNANSSSNGSSRAQSASVSPAPAFSSSPGQSIHSRTSSSPPAYTGFTALSSSTCAGVATLELPDLVAGLTIAGQRTSEGVPAVIDMTRRRTGVPRPPALEPPIESECGLKDETRARNASNVSTLSSVRAQLTRMSQRRIAPQQRQKLIRMGDRPPLGTC
jgi:hypothetical protein